MGLQDFLEFQGFRVDCAETCRQAFFSLEQYTYDAVLLDLELPDGDGSSVLAKLQISNPTLPVIVLTASNKDLETATPLCSVNQTMGTRRVVRNPSSCDRHHTVADSEVSQEWAKQERTFVP